MKNPTIFSIVALNMFGRRTLAASSTTRATTTSKAPTTPDA